jgi:hypothetical protein
VQTLNPTIGFAISCMSYIDAWSRGKLNVKRGLGFEVKKSGKRLTHIAKQQPQTTCTCIDYGQGPFTHTRLNMGGCEAVGTIFNTDLCQFGLVFQPTNEQVAECTQNHEMKLLGMIFMFGGAPCQFHQFLGPTGNSDSVKYCENGTHRRSRTTNIRLQFQLHAYLCTLLGPPWKGPQIPTSYKGF